MFSNIKNLSKKKIKNLSHFNLCIFYFLYIIVIIILSSIYCHLSISKFGIANENLEIIFRKLTFGFEISLITFTTMIIFFKTEMV